MSLPYSGVIRRRTYALFRRLQHFDDAGVQQRRGPLSGHQNTFDPGPTSPHSGDSGGAERSNV
jgi:hypothetical protein